MSIIPRTPPQKRQRASESDYESEITLDVYDQFTNKYLGMNAIDRSNIVEVITDYIDHPIYRYLLLTMTIDNVHYIMGYLRSQSSPTMHFILNRMLQ
jgi:hypothetical protein